MRHLCVILSYIAQYSLLLPLFEFPPCFSGNVASQLRIIGYNRLIQFRPINLLSHIWLVGFETLLTCTKYKHVNSYMFLIPSMYYKCYSLYIFLQIKGTKKNIAQNQTWTNNPNIFSVLLYHLSYLSQLFLSSLMSFYFFIFTLHNSF